MTTYDRSHSAFTFPNSPPTTYSVNSQPAQLTAQQKATWQQYIADCNHPVIVFGETVAPILLNDALREKLSEPASAGGIDQPVAFVWQTICEKIGQYVAEASLTNKPSISVTFPVHQQCIAAVGTVLRNAKGEFLGAVVNIADLSTSLPNLESLFRSANPQPVVDSEEAQQFFGWMDRRERARQKMSRLSRREHQVVSLVSDGLPNKSIARELDISVKTIEKHRANATRKLGVGSTPEMVRIAVIAEEKGPDVEPRGDEAGPTGMD